MCRHLAEQFTDRDSRGHGRGGHPPWVAVEVSGAAESNQTNIKFKIKAMLPIIMYATSVLKARDGVGTEPSGAILPHAARLLASSSCATALGLKRDHHTDESVLYKRCTAAPTPHHLQDRMPPDPVLPPALLLFMII